MPFERLNNPVVFTDLDGTLLDHDTYGFDEALPALSLLQQKKIPLVLNSSKTVSEIIDLRRELNNSHPFIAENGSVVGMPDGYFQGVDPAQHGFVSDAAAGLWINCIGGNRPEILQILGRIRDDTGFSFTGFSDISPSRLRRITGLSEMSAVSAKKRLSTEPILWQGTDKQWIDFTQRLARHGLAWVQGGRFISISRPFDKKDGVALLMDLYTSHIGVRPTAVGLGDSPNDQAMLNIMDIAVVVKSMRSDQVILDRPQTVIRTTLPGPGGWQQAVDEIFKTC